MDFVNQNKVESSSSFKGNHKKKKIFKNRMKGIEKKYHDFRTLCGVRALLYVKSEFNKDKNCQNGLVKTLPENPYEYQEIVKDYINYIPKTGKRKRGTDEGVLDSECMNDNKTRKLCNGYIKEENQQVNFNDQKLVSSTNLGNLPIEEIEKIERNLDPMFAKISERIDQLKEKNKSIDPSAKGCNKDGNHAMNEFPSLKPEFHSWSFPEELFAYNSVFENEFDYDNTNQEKSQPWLTLPEVTNTDDIVLAPFPDMFVFEVEPLSYYAGSLIY